MFSIESGPCIIGGGDDEDELSERWLADFLPLATAAALIPHSIMTELYGILFVERFSLTCILSHVPNIYGLHVVNTLNSSDKHFC